MASLKSKTKDLIVLIHPGTTDGEFPYMPYESIFMARFLERNGYEVIIVDQRVEQDWETPIRAHLDDILWIGLTVITGPQIRYALQTAARLREIDADLPLVWGGWHATFVPESTIAHPLVDYVVAGIGELKVLDLSRHIAAGQKEPIFNPGILHKSGFTSYAACKEPFEDLSDLPAYHLLDIERYRSDNNVAGMITSRGCPFRCGFCTIAQVSFINRPLDSVISEMEFLIGEKKFEEIGFSDGLFFAQTRRVESILDRLDEIDLKFKWKANIRPETLRRWSDDGIERLVNSGLYFVSTGVESGSEIMLNRIQKDADREDILYTAKKTAEFDIGLTMSFLSGLPHETVDDLRDSIDLIEKISAINPKIRILNPFYQPIPGAPTYDEMIRLGWTPPDSLEAWSGNIDYNTDIDDVEPFLWMSDSEFAEYGRVFKGSILNDLRLIGVLGKQ